MMTESQFEEDTDGLLGPSHTYPKGFRHVQRCAEITEVLERVPKEKRISLLEEMIDHERIGEAVRKEFKQQDLPDQLKAISKSYNTLKKAEIASAISAYFRDKFSIESVSIGGRVIEINGFKVEKIYVDQHLNLMCKIPKKFPVELLEPMAIAVEMFYEYGEGKGYKYRTITSLLIRYWKLHYKDITAEEVLKMLEIADRLPVESDDRSRKGFRAYFTTRSYVCEDGGVVNSGQFSDWPDLNKYKEMIKEDDDDTTEQDIQRMIGEGG